MNASDDTDRFGRYDTPFVIGLLKQMLLIRRFEEKCAQLYGLRKIGGFCHLYIGQEAVAVGSVAALDLNTDYIMTAYRDHGHALACGMPPGVAMAEMLGKATGCSKGKGGSMHLFDAQRHMMGGHAIVGSQIPLATGIGLKIRYKREKGVVLCCFGDGAVHQGIFHESLNLAKIWDIPVLYICENNHYGMGTDFRRVSSVTDFSVMGASYGIPGHRVNGMDVLDVYAAVADAVSCVRATSSPAFMEIVTYRYKGHSMSDPAKYRSKEELAEYRTKDPIVVLKQQLVDVGRMTEDDYRSLDDECRSTVAEAAATAEMDDEPPIEALYEDIWA